MIVSPLTVINETLGNLALLKEFLADEVDERLVHPRALTEERRLCKEALQTIRVLIPKLQAVRTASVAVTLEAARGCVNCDE